MNINKYTSYFHDGSILDIKSSNKSEMEIWMESSQLRPEWNEDNISLSKFETIKGVLYIKGIKSILVNNKFVEQIKIIYDDGEISQFDIYEDSIKLSIAWSNFPPKLDAFQFDNIIIKAEQYIWENVPNLFDPMGSELD